MIRAIIPVFWATSDPCAYTITIAMPITTRAEDEGLKFMGHAERGSALWTDHWQRGKLPRCSDVRVVQSWSNQWGSRGLLTAQSISISAAKEQTLYYGVAFILTSLSAIFNSRALTSMDCRTACRINRHHNVLNSRIHRGGVWFCCPFAFIRNLKFPKYITTVVYVSLHLRKLSRSLSELTSFGGRPAGK